MGVFNNYRHYGAEPCLIGIAVDALVSRFRGEGYEVQIQDLMSGGVDVSIRKGGTFKAVLGMKTALKVVIMPGGGGINAEASVGVFGQQAIPTVISMLIFWPVLLTQIWGLVKQSKLDDMALDTIGEALAGQGRGLSRNVAPQRQPTDPDSGLLQAYCPDCGKAVPHGARFCPECGKQL